MVSCSLYYKNAPNPFTMRITLLALLFLSSLSCSAQPDLYTMEVPYGNHPETPSQQALDKLDKVDFHQLEERAERGELGRIDRTYFLDGAPYTGWSLQVFPETEHRYRYARYEEGMVVWQIGYYENGDLDLDFHTKNGRNKGSQRMWFEGGKPYIDTHFLEGGIQHGQQLRWYQDGTLARDAVYEYGELVYEVLFDKSGQITERKGDVPEKYRS